MKVKFENWLLNNDFNTRYPRLYLFWSWVIAYPEMGFWRWFSWAFLRK